MSTTKSKRTRRARKAARRAAREKRQPEDEKSAASLRQGDDFLMFDNVEEASGFDFQEIDDRNAQARFLASIYIPQALRNALFPLARNKTGNRTNEITREWDRVESEHAQKRWRKWVFIKHERADKKALGFRNNLALAVAFVLLIWTGIGIQRATAPKTSTAPSAYSMTSTAAPKKPPAPAPPEVRRDDSGLLVQVKAADPQSVLVGFCRNAEGSLCEPVEIAWGVPRHADLRYGVYRSFYDVRAIQIVRNPRTRRWGVGDGRRPIDDFLAHARDMSHDRVPVQRR